MDQKALLERVRKGEVTVLDVRPSEEFQAGHIPGSLSVPLSELKQRITKLPKGEEIVAYCRGPYCVLAVEAVTLLRSHGFHACRLEAGVPEWRALGLKVASGKEFTQPPPRRPTRSRAKEPS